MNLLQIAAATTATSGYLAKIINMGIEYAPKLIGAIVVYLIGSWIINIICKGLGKVLNAKQYDSTLQSFLMSLVRIMLLIMLIISVIGMLGVDTTAFAGVLAGAGLAIGAAMNGSLGNLAGGVMMLIFRPFKKGDMIEAQSQTGDVLELGIFNTTILTADKKTVFIPNGPLSTGVITNYTTNGFLRVDLVMAIDPGMNIEAARSVAIDAMLSHPKVLKNPTPEVSVLKSGDGMVTLAVRPYCAQPDYWDVYFGSTELVKNAWDKAGILAPVPHRVIINK
jgi:small conductance mechanosensitive channel